MSIKLNDGTVLRNLEEQVQFLTNYHDVNQGIAQWGIRVVGTVASSSELPEPYNGEYGDAIAVGTKSPYFFYIWTRASIEGDSAYWFPFGEINIIGPEGPVGPKGPKGDIGESSKWYTNPTLYPENPQFKNGDMLLTTSPGIRGNVYRYIAGNPAGKKWYLETNIVGPQGIQGVQGPKGERGPQGPQGQKGDTGDVGGFINIYGILTDINQLPNPDYLDNRTIAYLIGTGYPYDLYIQVGDADGPVNWVNSGPLNVSTLVTVNGNYQNIWDADTKVDKRTNVTSEQQVYAKDRDGTQTVLNILQSPTSGSNGIPNKKYIDDLPSNSKTESGPEYYKIYAKDDLSDKAWKIFTPGSFKLASSDWGYTTDWTPSQIIHSVLQADGSSLTKIFEFPNNSGTIATTAEIATAKSQLEKKINNLSEMKFLRQEIPANGEVTLLPNSLYMISVAGNNVCLKDSSDLTNKGQFLIVFCADIGTAGPGKFAVMGMVYGGGLNIDTFTVVATNGVTKLKNYNKSSTAGYNLLVKQ